MSPTPDFAPVREFLARAARRLALVAAAYGAAAGFAMAGFAAAFAVGRTPAAGLVLGALGAVTGALFVRRAPRHVAARVEARGPLCRNVVLTAAELAAGTARAHRGLDALVYRDAARAVERLEPHALFPAWRALGALGASAALWVAALAFAAARPALGGGSPAVPVGGIGVDVEVTIAPPSYATRDTQTIRDPARIEVLEGSTLRVSVRTRAASVVVETLEGSRTLGAVTPGVFGGEIVADGDGYVAVEARGADGTVAARRLIGLTVVRDNAPRVRITLPGRDLMFDSLPLSLAVSVEADDDIGLLALSLRYTRVSGSGEQFTFTDGEVPLTVTRTDARSWTARGVLPLNTLGLVPGDVIVYRGVASDRRPGAPPSESDAFIVELTAPGAAVAGGFAIDDDQDRYGVSQQMVILMTERLLAERTTLSAADFARESQTLAAAQRRVRAEFVFMLGGELADEVEVGGLLELDEHAHAAADDDEAIAGRLANQGRLDLLRAIRAMSRAASALNTAEPDRALPDEREALTMLQRAFSRTRYILRTLTERERIDLSRRLSGSLAAVTRDVRPVATVEADDRVTTLRQSLAGVATLAGSAELTVDEAIRASVLAQRVLGVDASSEPLRLVSDALTEAGAAIGRADNTVARARLDSAATLLAAALRSELRRATREPRSLDLRTLAGALADALREPGMSR